MKYFKSTYLIVTLLLLSVLTAVTGIPSYAANDDPGAGRLSGDYISEDFYSTDNTTLPLIPFGSSTLDSSYTNTNYTHQDAFDDRTILHGIDVSKYQADIDWQKVKAAGIDFAFIQVGYRGYGSAGTLSDATKDPYFDTNMKNAIAAGIQVGVYVFSQATTTTEAIEEADYILNALSDYTISMPLVMDFEYASTNSGLGGRLYNAKLSKNEATSVCMAFCNRIAEAGYTPMVYANKSMLEDQLNASTITDAGYHIWLANYTTNTKYAGTFDFWQYSEKGKVDGISGNVDMNFYYMKEGDNFVPNANSISKAVVNAIPNQSYTGSNITPAITVSFDGTPLIEGTDYTLSYSSNKKVGTATVKIIGRGIYRDVKKVTFKIVPKTPSSLKAKKRSTDYITLSWKKDSNANGYEIYRSTSLNGSYKKIKTITKNSTITYKNTKLNNGKCYYYKIRSYKTVSKQKYYSEYTAVKAIYTKTGYTRNALTKKEAALYNEAATDSTLLVTIPKNTSLSVTYSTKDKSNNTWYYVSYKTDDTTYKGFVPASKLTITKVGKIVKTNTVNVRKSYSTSSKKLTTLKRNKKVTVLSTKKKKGVTWYKVTFKKGKKTYNGWISAPYVKIV